MTAGPQVTLLLLHGAWQGAWCWASLEVELATRGIESISLDLPAGDPAAGVETYVDAVCQAATGHDDLVVVAHSLAGLIAPSAAQRLQARGLVMLAALWPQPATSPREQARALPGIYTDLYRHSPQIHLDDGSTRLPAAVAHDLLFHDCEAQVAHASAARLRPQHWGLWSQPSPLASWPTIPTVGLACRDDRMLGAAGMVAGAARVSAPLAWLDGGHSPMLARPQELADVLAGLLAPDGLPDMSLDS